MPNASAYAHLIVRYTVGRDTTTVLMPARSDPGLGTALSTVPPACCTTLTSTSLVGTPVASSHDDRPQLHTSCSARLLQWRLGCGSLTNPVSSTATF